MSSKNIYLILVFFFLLIGKELYAQDQMGFYAIPMVSKLEGAPTDGILKKEASFSYGFGVEYIKYFDQKYRSRLIGGRLVNDIKSRHGLRFGLHYNATNQDWTARYDQGGEEIVKNGRKRLRYFKLPVTYQYIVPFNHKIRFKLFTGPQLSYLFMAEGGLVAFEDRGDTDFFDLPAIDDRSKYYNTFGLDWVFAGGIYFKVTRWWNATFLARLEYSLTELEKQAQDEYGNDIYTPGSDPNTRNLMLGLMIGAEYTFHRAEHSRTKF